MKKRKKSREQERKEFEALNVRLDAIVAILLKAEFADENGKIKISEAAPILHRSGYSPTEIAKLLGKKKSSDVAPYLYTKKKKRIK